MAYEPTDLPDDAIAFLEERHLATLTTLAPMEVRMWPRSASPSIAKPNWCGSSRLRRARRCATYHVLAQPGRREPSGWWSMAHARGRDRRDRRAGASGGSRATIWDAISHPGRAHRSSRPRDPGRSGNGSGMTELKTTVVLAADSALAAQWRAELDAATDIEVIGESDAAAELEQRVVDLVPDVVLASMDLPALDITRVCAELNATVPVTRVIVVAGQHEAPSTADRGRRSRRRDCGRAPRRGCDRGAPHSPW